MKSGVKYQLKKLSKLMDFALRCRPDELGLVPDSEGYVSIRELLQALKEEDGWSYLRLSHLEEVLHDRNYKGLFDISGHMVRARFEEHDTIHFLSGPVEPPKLLYHATRTKAYPFIMKEGLRPFKGPYVFLSSSKEIAIRMGRRRDPDPVLVEVRALDAFRDGITFYRSNDLIYLSSRIPPKYISGPPIPKETPAKNKREKIPEALPGSFYPDIERELMGFKRPLNKKERKVSTKDKRSRKRKGFGSRWNFST